MGKKKISGMLFVLMVAGVILGVDVIQGSGLIKVRDRSHVCMLKNRAVGQPLIPVQVEGNTYYGCCEICTGTLQKSRKERFAVDPVTKREVDKARAVIGVLTGGEVLYFEDEKSFQAFSK